MQEKPYQVFFWKALKVSNLLEVCLFAAISEEKVPIYYFLLNVFDHQIEVVMSWQIYREVTFVEPAYQIATTFLRQVLKFKNR